MQIFGYSSRSRKSSVNPDGTMDVHCRECFQFIGRFVMRPGMTMITCSDCASGKTPSDRAPKKEEDPLSLYSPEEMAAVKTEDKVGFIRTMFRAFGLPKAKPAALKPSQEVSKSKRRQPLFKPVADKEIRTEEDDE